MIVSAATQQHMIVAAATQEHVTVPTATHEHMIVPTATQEHMIAPAATQEHNHDSCCSDTTAQQPSVFVFKQRTLQERTTLDFMN